MALATRAAQLALIIPKANAREAGVVQGIDIYPAEHLSQVVEFLSGREPLAPLAPEAPALLAPPPAYEEDFRDVRGQTAVFSGAGQGRRLRQSCEPIAASSMRCDAWRSGAPTALRVSSLSSAGGGSAARRVRSDAQVSRQGPSAAAA